jgi:hypothetical protein
MSELFVAQGFGDFIFIWIRITKAYTKLEANVKLQDCHKIETKGWPYEVFKHSTLCRRAISFKMSIVTMLPWCWKYKVHTFCLFPLKVHKHEIFLNTFFAETETLWSQGPVTRDFWKSYSIRPRYSTFKHFRARSACDEIGSQYAQHAMKLVPRMLSVR